MAVVERKLVGGTCVNYGCRPTKTLVASAHVAHVVHRGEEYGIGVGSVAIDLPKVKARKDKVVLEDREYLESWLENLAGCTLIRGHARFENDHALRVDDQLIEADRIFLNVGGRAVIPDIPGLSEIDYMTNVSILELSRVPEHLVIIGGSYIGLEFAQIYRRFGASVTVVERGPRLTRQEDEDISTAIKEILEAEGIQVVLDAGAMQLSKLANGEKGFELRTSSGGAPISGTDLLVAVGRRPNTDDLGLEHAGVQTDAAGWITVNDQLRTNVEHIWAMGDCNGRGAFTHTSYNDFEIVAANLLDDDPRRVSDRITTYALYVDPPLGRAGMTLTEARQSGRNLLVGKRPMTRVGRAVEKGETQGFMKVIVDADTEEILGAAVLGVGGDEVIHSILDIMTAKKPYTTIARTVHIHPTVSELVPDNAPGNDPPFLGRLVVRLRPCARGSGHTVRLAHWRFGRQISRTPFVPAHFQRRCLVCASRFGD